jgi:hypothetical protein
MKGRLDFSRFQPISVDFGRFWSTEIDFVQIPKWRENGQKKSGGFAWNDKYSINR